MMRRLTVIYKPGDVVVVPFPFTDKLSNKRRPALVVSSDSDFNAESGHVVLAMITSAANSPWPLDVELSDLTSAGLSSPSKVRMKLFTLDARLIIKTAGRLATDDADNVNVNLCKLISA